MAVKTGEGPGGLIGQPQMNFNMNNLRLKNNSGGTNTYTWSIILSRDS